MICKNWCNISGTNMSSSRMLTLTLIISFLMTSGAFANDQVTFRLINLTTIKFLIYVLLQLKVRIKFYKYQEDINMRYVCVFSFHPRFQFEFNRHINKSSSRAKDKNLLIIFLPSFTGIARSQVESSKMLTKEFA